MERYYTGSSLPQLQLLDTGLKHLVRPCRISADIADNSLSSSRKFHEPQFSNYRRLWLYVTYIEMLDLGMRCFGGILGSFKTPLE